jgi:hypothetical protein
VEAATTPTVQVSYIGVDSVLVSWPETNDACFTKYEVHTKVDGSSTWRLEDTFSDAADTSTIILNLQADTLYTVRVTDFDCFGNATGETPVRTHNVVALTEVAKTLTTATVEWTQSNALDLCFGFYSVQYRSSAGAWVETDNITSRTTTTTTIEGLSPGTTYNIRVIERDCFGGPDFESNSISLVLIAHSDANLRVVSALGGAVELQWAAPNVNETCFSRYLLQYRLQSTSAWQTYKTIAARTQVNSSVTGLAGGQTFEFRLVTEDCWGAFESTIVSSKIIGLPLLSIDATTRDHVAVHWPISEDPCFQNYALQVRETGSTSWTTSATVTDKATTSGAIAGLKAGTTYEVRVVETGCNEARSSAPLSVQTSAPPGAVESMGGPAVVGGIVVGIILAAAVGFMVLGRRKDKVTIEPTRIVPPAAPPAPTVPPPDGAKAAFCSQCGSKVSGPFCASCGAKAS